MHEPAVIILSGIIVAKMKRKRQMAQYMSRKDFFRN